MPEREIPLISGEIYHVLNRGISWQPVFINKKGYQRFLETMLYYQNKIPPLRYSKFLALSVEDRKNILESLKKQKDFVAEILGYCLMPNHFHLLLRQIDNGGIAKFVSNLTNSYTRYFNVKNKRFGPLFQGKFKAIRIENDEQLVHVLRYIHLNPYSSFVVGSLDKTILYPYSSLAEYLKLTQSQTVSKELIMDNFKTLKSFREFTFNQADYQRKLQDMKHLLLEKR